MNLELLSFSVVVTGTAHNPSILNPDFLERREIVPKEWGWQVGAPPITTPPFSQVQYATGVTISVETGKLQVSDEGGACDPNQSRIDATDTYEVTEGNIFTHGPFVRFTMAFGDEPKPMMTAMEEPAPIPRNFIVFFDWDRSDLTNEAKGVIASAASYAAQGGVSNIQLVGHADRSGAVDYNVGLSKRRADTVKGELVSQHSLSPTSILTAWEGESDNLVATADGVREAQNRRVTINLL